MTDIKKPELNFLWEISSVLTQNYDEQELMNKLKAIFEQFLFVKNFQIFMWDSISATLRDFVKSWIIIDKNIQSEKVIKIFETLSQHTQDNFILNGALLDFNKPALELEYCFDSCIKQNNNIIYFPLYREKKLKGVLELSFDEVLPNVKKYDFIFSIGIAIRQIAAAISNKLMKDAMTKNIDFYKSMKNIAKLIETQYELTYILPIIGEMVDKFITNHLIYIFMKDNENYFRLVWPLECKDEQIYELLEHITEEKLSEISDTGTTGVWAIKSENEVIGAIAAGSYMDKLADSDIAYMTLLAKQISVTVQKANSYGEMLKYATLDALTGLNNRRQFEIRLNQEVATAKRKQKPLCCIMIDIDYFKKVNDTYGHSAGDCVLKRVAAIIKQELREYDIASRYGGEEFCILLPFTTPDEAAFVAQRLRKAVEKTPINISEEQVEGETINVSISVGVSSYDENIETPAQLYQNADMALYEAKRRGRNKVIFYNDIS